MMGVGKQMRKWVEARLMFVPRQAQLAKGWPLFYADLCQPSHAPVLQNLSHLTRDQAHFSWGQGDESHPWTYCWKATCSLPELATGLTGSKPRWPADRVVPPNSALEYSELMLSICWRNTTQPNLSPTRLDTQCSTSQGWISSSLLSSLLQCSFPLFPLQLPIPSAQAWSSSTMPRDEGEQEKELVPWHPCLKAKKTHHKQQPGRSPVPIVFANYFLL